MRDIYLIDFENVASEGLSGITFLDPDDQVIIFYSNNSNRLTMKMHILIGKSVCQFKYFEVTVGGKNALDHQIATWLGFLVGTRAADRNYFIVSRDMGYKFVASFWTDSELKVNVRCVDSIRAAGRLERSRQARAARETAVPAAPVQEAVDAVPEPEQIVPPEPEQIVPSEPEQIVPLEPEQIVPSEPEQIISPEPEQTAPAIPEETAPELPAEPVTESQPEQPPVSDEPETVAQAEPQAEPVRDLIRAAYPQDPVEVPLDEVDPEEEAAAARSRSRSRSRRERARSSRTDTGARQTARADARRQSPPKPDQKDKKQSDQKDKKPDQKQSRQKQNKKSEEPRRVDLTDLIAPYPQLQEQHLQQLIADGKKQMLCNHLRKHLGQEKGLALYNEIKKRAWH